MGISKVTSWLFSTIVNNPSDQIFNQDLIERADLYQLTLAVEQVPEQQQLAGELQMVERYQLFSNSKADTQMLKFEI
ncbi:hypothetical protein BpHYR1_037559 [Brachionus plicatilis]|uniref:Uncharacterized protein n=1 Tax=Brachionus plicatilis TaxID=10195 RepID=A0A3M7QIR7_BRAPC|nr:hypothetical protein BpHYR1_037559 [Brachionus plicatilis]